MKNENLNKQTTIQKEISLHGVGLHTGKEVTLTFKPASAGSGYAFKRMDLEGAPEIQANANFVTETQRGTTQELSPISNQVPVL